MLYSFRNHIVKTLTDLHVSSLGLLSWNPPCAVGGRNRQRTLFMIDIRDYPEVVDAINSIVNNGSIAEVKKEKNHRDRTVTILVIEQYRVIKHRHNLDD